MTKATGTFGALRVGAGVKVRKIASGTVAVDPSWRHGWHCSGVRRESSPSDCRGSSAVRQDVVDQAILRAITEVLRPDVLSLAVDKALAKLAHSRSRHAGRRAQVERDLADIQRKVDKLLDALTDSSLPTDEIRARLSTEKGRKSALVAELEKLDQMAKVAGVDTAQLKRQIEGRVSDVTSLLVRHTVQARQMLRKLLAGKIELEPVGSGRERAYKFRGALTIEKLIGGQASNTPVCGGPNGIRALVGHLSFEIRGSVLRP